MTSGEPDLLVRYPWVARRPLTVAENHKMGEVRILTEDDRVELIEGPLVARSPIGSQHSGTANTLNRPRMHSVGDRGVVTVGNPVPLDDLSEPQPDLMVLRPEEDDYREATPRSVDVRRINQVADGSLAYGHNVKRALYSRHGIPECWTINVPGQLAEVRWRPVNGGHLHPGVRIPVSILTR